MEDCQNVSISDNIDELSKQLFSTYKFFQCSVSVEQNLDDLFNENFKKISQLNLKDVQKSQNKRKMESNLDCKGKKKNKSFF